MFDRFRTEHSDIAIIDPVFPQANPFAFRNVEIGEYLKNYTNITAYAMSPMKPGPDAWFSHGYGIERDEYERNKSGYLNYYPGRDKQIKYLNPDIKYKIGLAYSFFLAETYTLLPFYKKHDIPFVFVLYPGGGFGLDNPSSDKMLSAIFSSDQFRSVIVTQQITKEYLEMTKLCPPDKISYVYGGFVQFNSSEVKPKKKYGKDKDTFDICFVAAKYSDRGVDKGYDVFVEVARELTKRHKDIRFHVVGGFEKEEINVESLGGAIKFYGYKGPDFLKQFYSGMDIFLGPNRSGQLFPGNFDGFPLGIDAAYCGVGLLVADPLGINTGYTDGKDIEIIDHNSESIVDKISHYYHNSTQLYDLSAKGQATTQALFDIELQISRRIEVFNKFVTANPRSPR